MIVTPYGVIEHVAMKLDPGARVTAGHFVSNAVETDHVIERNPARCMQYESLL